MRKVLTAAVAAFFAVSAIAPAVAGPLPKPTESSDVTKVSLPPAKPFKFGLVAPKNQSVKPAQTAWICFTPMGQCHVPFLGYCCCNFWNGFAWVTWCGNT